MSLSGKELVVQHNRIIEARYRLSVGEQRIIKLLISMIKKDDVDFKSYPIPIKQLAELLGVADNDFYRQVKSTTQRLISNVLIFKTIDGNQELQVAWLSSAKYIENKGIVELEFSPELKPFLLQLKNNITYYKLGNVIHLKNAYSIRIYELLKQYESIGKRRFDITTLRNTLGIKENEYTRFNDFRRWVLKVSQQEIADKTDIVFTWEEEKQAQKCIAITFIISKQNSFQYIEEKGRQLVYEVQPSIKTKAEPPLNEQVERLVSMGVTRSTAEQIAVEFDQERIERAIAYTKGKQQEGGVKNPAAFVVTAIKKDYTDALAAEKRKKAEALRLQREKDRLKKEWEAIKTRYSDWKMQAIEAALSGMTAEEQEGHRQQFSETPAYGMMMDTFRKNKTIQHRLFLTFMLDRVPLDTLEQWAQKNALDLSVFADGVRGN